MDRLAESIEIARNLALLARKLPPSCLSNVAYATLFQAALIQKGPQNSVWRWTVRILTALCISYAQGNVQIKVAVVLTSFVLSSFLSKKQQFTARNHSEILRLNKELLELQGKLAKQKESLDGKDTELKNAKDELEQQLRTQAEALQKRQASLDAEYKELKNAKDELEQQLRTQVKALQQRQVLLDQESEKLEKAKGESDKQLTTQAGSLQELQASLDAERAELKKTKDEFEQQLRTKKKELGRHQSLLDQESEKLQKAKNEFNRQLTTQAGPLKQLQDSLGAERAELEKIKDEFNRQLAELTERSQESAQLIQELRKEVDEKSRKLVEERRNSQSSESCIAVLRNTVKELIARVSGLESELDGQRLINMKLGEEMTSLSQPQGPASDKERSAQKELKRLKNILATYIENKTFDWVGGYRRLKQRSENLYAQLRLATNDVNAQNSEISSLRASVQPLKEELQQLKLKIAQLERNKDLNLGAIRERDSRISELNRRIQELHQLLIEKKSSENLKAQEIKSLNRRMETAHSEIDTLRKKNRELLGESP